MNNVNKSLITPVIELVGVSKTFGEVRSLSNVDFKVFPGEIVGLLGDNGAGKSTLVKTVMGFHVPDQGGKVFFKGKHLKLSMSESGSLRRFAAARRASRRLW